MALVARTLIVGMLTVGVLASQASGAAPRGITRADRIRIVEARRLAERLGDVVWPGWRDAPFAILLITGPTEYLLYHDSPGPDFAAAGHDSLLGCDVYTRDRVFDKNLLATFPAVGGVPTIVIGQAENTNAGASTRWVLTVLHEHFHQWQQSWPDYYPSTLALGLAGDDKSGMWMLDYPFPYEDDQTGAAFVEMEKCLVAALEADAGALHATTRDYLAARAQFAAGLAEKDYRYFSFQLWQEGVSRYTELLLAKAAAGGYAPDPAFKHLPDYTPYDETYRTAYDHILDALSTNTLAREKRSAFYAVGAGEGLLLDRLGVKWRPFYAEEKFYLEKYFDRASEALGE